LIAALHALLARIFAGLVAPFDALAPAAGLWLVSALAGVGLLVAFRWTSNPVGIRAARQKTQAHLLAVRLYREDLSVVGRSQVRFLVWLGRYLGHMLVPFAAVALPFALLFAQLDAHYACRALRPGERTIVKVLGAPAVLEAATLEASDGVAVESGPVRIAERGEIDWRVLARVPGRQRVTLVAGGQRIDKEVRVTGATEGAPARRMAASLSSLLFAPAEAAFDGAKGVEVIEVGYPTLEIRVLGWRTSWIVIFLAVSALVALGLRRRAGVEF
jgi:hypothetical protein